ncbi:MAG: DHH family phosphoesterase [Candidatus Paceibacter sp.]|nr:DHH family phosphoesterase [Candidatus Paceibacter sp.]
MKKEIVVLHHNDEDGFGAAYAAWRKFGDKAEYIPVSYEMKPAELSGKEIYMLDFCYDKKSDLQRLIKNNKKVVIIDHHKSKKDDIKIASEYVYDIDHSGAVLAWQYFHPGNKVPVLLFYIEDYDLWKFKIPNTKEIMALVEMTEFDFDKWDKLATELEDEEKLKKNIEEGSAALRYKEYLVKEISGDAEKAEFEGYQAMVVNSTVLKSEIGNFLVKSGAEVGIIWSERKGEKAVSLRSGSKVDVAKLAEKYGGGGHKSAAGFGFDAKLPAPWKIIKEETQEKNER